MIETHGKLLITAFIVILLGVVLIQPIGTDVELTKVSSRTILNESVALTATTVDIANETNTLAAGNTTTLTHNYLATLTALRNITSEDLITYCNVTLTTGAVKCNDTGNTTIYAQYTYNDYSTGQLSTSYDEWLSFDACRNSGMSAILAGTHCNVTVLTGAVKVNYDNFSDNLAYIDYKYEPDTYVHSGTARTLITLVVLFFAIAILAVGIGFVVKSLKASDLL